MSASIPVSIDYSRKWKVMGAVSMGVLFATIDGSILNVALPTLVTDLKTTFPVLQWVVLAYLLTMATLTLLIGRLGDLMGKRSIFTSGFIVFTVASVLCAASPSVGWLISFRIVQALGAAMTLSLGTAILTEAFPPSERGRALGMIGTVVSIGIVSGPFLGGLLIEAASWRWIFLVNLPVGIIGTLTAWRFVPKTPGSPTASIDVAGAATLCIALLSFSLALTLGQDAGFGAPPILGLFAGAALALAAFIRVELRTPEPMIQLRLLANPSLASSIASGYLGFIAIGGYFLILPFYLEASLGLDPAATGRLLAIGPIALGVVAPLSGRLSDRIGVRPLTISGLVFLTIAYAAGSRLGVDTTVAQFLTLTIPVGIGMGVFQSPNNSAVMGAVGRLHAGFGGGLLALTRILGQLTGIAVLGSVWAWRIAARGGGSIGEASPGAVAGATSDTLLLMGAMMAVATLIAVWGVAKERSPSVSVTPG